MTSIASAAHRHGLGIRIAAIAATIALIALAAFFLLTTGQLSAGADSLSDGAGRAGSGSSELAAGAEALAGGAGELSDGADSAADGSGDLAEGAASASAGAARVEAGAVKADDGAHALADGAATSESARPTCSPAPTVPRTDPRRSRTGSPGPMPEPVTWRLERAGRRPGRLASRTGPPPSTPDCSNSRRGPRAPSRVRRRSPAG